MGNDHHITALWAAKGGSGTTVTTAAAAIHEPGNLIIVDLQGDMTDVLPTPRPLSDLMSFSNLDSEAGAPVFRGQGDMNWGLIPALHRFRVPEHPTSWAASEDHLLDKSRHQSWSMVTGPPALSFGDWMALGRHHGLPTRLLDWSESPLIAAYSAASSNPESAGCVWRLKPRRRLRLGEVVDADSFDQVLSQEPGARFDPLGMHPRFRAQQGLFTAAPLPSHKGSHTSIEKLPHWIGILDRLIIERPMKEEFRRDLDAIGIDHFSVFPDLDGLGGRITRRLSHL